MDEFTKYKLKKLQESLKKRKSSFLEGKDIEQIKKDNEKMRKKYGFDAPILEDPMADEFTIARLKKLKEKAEAQGRDIEASRRDLERLKDYHGINTNPEQTSGVDEFTEFKNKQQQKQADAEKLKDLYYRDQKKVPKITTDELNLDPNLNDLEKHKTTKEAHSQQQMFKNMGLDLDYSKPIHPDSEISDPRSPEYNRLAAKDYLPEGQSLQKWENYWKDVGHNANPTWEEWGKTKQFELGTPSEPVLPSLAAIATLIGAQKALEVPEAGAGSDVVPEDEQLDRRFKKLKGVLENK